VCPPPPNPSGGRHTRLRGTGWGDPVQTAGPKLWYSTALYKVRNARCEPDAPPCKTIFNICHRGRVHLKDPWFRQNRQDFRWHKSVKYFVSITYEAQRVMEKNIMSQECVKASQHYPSIYGRIYSARQSQLCNKTLPEETTTALKSGMTFTHKSVWGVNKFNILF
jgi:hypothetical protein